MEDLLGYCQPGNFDKKVEVPPPPHDPQITQNVKPLELPLSGPLDITEKDVRDALLNHASKFCCYGKGVVNEMVITKMDHFYSYRYSLETFIETRQVCWAYEPYHGGHVDAPTMKQFFDPWELKVDPLRQFDRHEIKLIMPHTECLQTCPDCAGAGRIKCETCRGKGKTSCSWCNGSGYVSGFSSDDRQMCTHCYAGTVTCARCKGKGIHGCSICSEAGEIKCFVQLNVHWNNFVDSCLIEHSDTPKDLIKDMIKKASGELIYEEINDLIKPIKYYQGDVENKSGVDLLYKHVARYLSRAKPLAHRQRVHRIPVTKVTYSWRDSSQEFWVFGNEKYVYAPNYQQKCCCGCSIL